MAEWVWRVTWAEAFTEIEPFVICYWCYAAWGLNLTPFILYFWLECFRISGKLCSVGGIDALGRFCGRDRSLTGKVFCG